MRTYAFSVTVTDQGDSPVAEKLGESSYDSQVQLPSITGRMYPFVTEPEKWKEKYYPVVVHNQIKRPAVTYPFEVIADDIYDAIMMPIDLGQEMQVTLTVVDVTTEYIAQETIINAYWYKEDSFIQNDVIKAEVIHEKALFSEKLHQALVINEETFTSKSIKMVELNKSEAIYVCERPEYVEFILETTEQKRNLIIEADEFITGRSELQPAFLSAELAAIQSTEGRLNTYEASRIDLEKEEAIPATVSSHIINIANSTDVRVVHIEQIEQQPALESFQLLDTKLLVPDELELYATEAKEILDDMSNFSFIMSTGDHLVDHFVTPDSYETEAFVLLQDGSSQSDAILMSNLEKESLLEKETVLILAENLIPDESISMATTIDIEQASQSMFILGFSDVSAVVERFDKQVSHDLFVESFEIQNDRTEAVTIIDADKYSTDTAFSSVKEELFTFVESDYLESGTEPLETIVITDSQHSKEVSMKEAMVITDDQHSKEALMKESMFVVEDHFYPEEEESKEAILIKETLFDERETEIKGSLTELDGNQQYALLVEEIKFEGMSPQITQYEIQEIVEASIKSTANEINSVGVMGEEISGQDNTYLVENTSFEQLTFDDVIELNQTSPDLFGSSNTLTVHISEADNQLTETMIDILINQDDTIRNEIELDTVVTVPDDVTSNPVISVSFSSMDNFAKNTVFSVSSIEEDHITFKPIIAAEAVQLTEAEWLSDVPADVVDIGNGDEFEEINRKKKIWLIPARANWYSKWFTKKTR
ncbi:hypothetical protein CJ483_08550 [Bacillus sp. PK3_68]|nr:hypothetical protein CJ483_08550 [Bacillus sp. PK3_68]